MSETELLESKFAGNLEAQDRFNIWESAHRILDQFDVADCRTGLALGYVQSGKTTQMMALTAAAHDVGVRIIIAFLGSTNLLLDQNTDRFAKAFDFEIRMDFKWIVEKNPSKPADADRIQERLLQGRTIFIPVIKNAGRIDGLATVLQTLNLTEIQVLVIDDEADQASLNTMVNKDEESKTFKAIRRVRDALPIHLYIQFTATPYAPLLLDSEDHLSPDFVEFLTPGQGYTGGKEFFIDHAETVLRIVPASDEQVATAKNFVALPDSLVSALANFFAGAVLLDSVDPSIKPVSMLIHSTHRNNLQDKYLFLTKRLKESWLEDLNLGLPAVIQTERDRLVSSGVLDIPQEQFLSKLKMVLGETTFWLVNSVSDVKKIRWNESPYHVLVGGNKLDRGFTVEGLTVTYMNRPSSDQIDTLEQRARAFGYRGELIPFCQFFGTAQTIRILRGVVSTEYDLRARLSDWLELGGTPAEWSKEIGLLLPKGAKPTRSNVIQAIESFNNGSGWHQLRRPSFELTSINNNLAVVNSINMLDAPRVDYGRIEHRTLQMSNREIVELLLQKWDAGDFSPGWDHAKLTELVQRMEKQVPEVKVTLMQYENEDKARERTWVSETGFNNLFQGEDQNKSRSSWYPGDKNLLTKSNSDGSPHISLQIHRVRKKNQPESPELFTLTLNVRGSMLAKRSAL